ncbi:hypothetical protein POSPLADRAFT_1043540 [Postia placenta MAD-698-R-SB12]|uniref:AMP-dependent synthetase/ligase domain-containing protein n=1 Tax=Postia placenta MAD-698-R-SB12 TaxID=670580 RepID=A0A1X6NBK1_9APHY|nr:hypothetical protein POSPLADRAFT_1043540 [Postia placenta MAD-698-R-SB12]OSX66017.1 hypothetical protein POSPLADRAFT_1043540 [Postia placenta MAD-698-R-SB12]
MDTHFAHSRLLWRPANPARTSLDAFRRMVNRKHGLNLRDYHDLHRYSVEDYEFWLDVWEFVGILHSVPPTKILEDGRMKELPTWFPGARLNYAENLLYRNDDGIACTAARETGAISHYTFRQLRELVRITVAALRMNGVGKGDRVAAIVTNHIDAVVLALASASIGAIFSSTATDMGTQGILDRYQQIQPKIVFSETEVTWLGKTIDLIPKVAEVANGLASYGLQRVVLLPSAKTGTELSPSTAAGVPKSISLSAFLSSGDNRELQFEQLPFNHPLYILYSSGTTGPPKCIIHTAGGVLLQAKKDMRLSMSMSSDDTYFQYTTTGWMMWPYMLQGLACGARIIAYDGSPFYPNVHHFLKFLSAEGVTIFGTSARFLSEVQGQGVEPCIQIQGKLLGMKVEIFDPDGKNVEDTGMPGELVCTRPHPSLPLGFWGDDSGEKVRKAYFDRYPGVWHHADFIVKNPETQGLMILGRSDGVLNPSGVRFGSAEIYSVLEGFSDAIDDSLCIGQRRPQDRDERVLLFLKMRPGHAFTNDLTDQIRSSIRKALSPRHVPAYIFSVEDIPYTVNGKKIEIAVKQIVSGSNLKPSGTVANPESLTHYYKFRELEKLVGSRAKL